MPKDRHRVINKEQLGQSTSPYTVDITNKDQTTSQVPSIHDSKAAIISSGGMEAKPESPSDFETPQTIETRTNLIVNYLPQAMTQEDLRLLFNSAGELDTCKLIRDKNNGQSLGYAFVNYKRPEGAMKAINSFNGLRLQNKAIKVSFARPSSDMIKGSNLYISGLSRHFTTQSLYNLFIPFGQIITCRLLCDPINGKSKGVGFIRYNLKSQAEEAIKHLNGRSPDDMSEPITVKFANQPTFSTSKALAAAAAQLNSKIALTPQPLAILIQPGGGNMAASVYGVVQAPQQQSTPGYSCGLDSVVPIHTPLITQSLGQHLQQQPTTNSWCLVIHNLPPDFDDISLTALVSRYVPVLNARVVSETGVKGRQVGVIIVNNHEDCMKVIGALDGLFIDQDHMLNVTFARQSQTSTSSSPHVIGPLIPAQTSASAAGLGPGGIVSASGLSGLPTGGLASVTAAGTELAAASGIRLIPIAAANNILAYNNNNASVLTGNAAAETQLYNSGAGIFSIPSGYIDSTYPAFAQTAGNFLKMGQLGPYYTNMVPGTLLNGYY